MNKSWKTAVCYFDGHRRLEGRFWAQFQSVLKNTSNGYPTSKKVWTICARHSITPKVTIRKVNFKNNLLPMKNKFKNYSQKVAQSYNFRAESTCNWLAKILGKRIGRLGRGNPGRNRGYAWHFVPIWKSGRGDPILVESGSDGKIESYYCKRNFVRFR